MHKRKTAVARVNTYKHIYTRIEIYLQRLRCVIEVGTTNVVVIEAKFIISLNSSAIEKYIHSWIHAIVIQYCILYPSET